MQRGPRTVRELQEPAAGELLEARGHLALDAARPGVLPGLDDLVRDVRGLRGDLRAVDAYGPP